MALEERKVNILINTAGGTAGPGGRTYRVALRRVGVKQLGITETKRKGLLQFDGESITLRPMAPDRYDAFLADARSRGHKLLILHFYDGNTLCTKSVPISLPVCLPLKMRWTLHSPQLLGSIRHPPGMICKPFWRIAAFPSSETGCHTTWKSWDWITMILWPSSGRPRGAWQRTPAGLRLWRAKDGD